MDKRGGRTKAAGPPADYRAIDAVLEAEYRAEGAGKAPLLTLGRRNILDTLILTVLSQATNDRLSAKAFADLKAAFPDWEAALQAPAAAVAEAIRHGGLAGQKAPRIQRILARIKADHGRLDLEFLRNWPAGRAYEYLNEFEGVGPKTAACTLLFAAGQPLFPVDTHILRLVRRMGLAPEKATAEAVQRQLNGEIPEDLRYRLHVNLIEHGRTVCHPRKPECQRCVVRLWCSWGQEREKSGEYRP